MYKLDGQHRPADAEDQTLFEYPEIDPVAISIGPLSIHWYGLMYVLGFFVAWYGFRLRARRPDSPIDPGRAEDLVFYGALGVFIGGRLGYMLLYFLPANGPGALLADPLAVFRVWEGGMAFHGGLVGVLIAMWLFARRQGLTYFEVTDFIAPWVPPALGFGRIGNFINGELWGKPTSADAPWSVVYQGVPRHPSQLYEAFLEGLVLFLILYFFSARPRPTMAVSGMFLLGYGVFRTAVEFVRVPDDGIYFAWGWLTKGQLFSVPMILAGIVLLILAYRGTDRAASAANA